MKKIILPNILDIYWADGEGGRILTNKYGRMVEKPPTFEKGRYEGRVRLHFSDGHHMKYRVGYLILIAYDGYRDLRAWDYRFKNGNKKDARYCNLEWQDRLDISNIFTDAEWALYVQRLEYIKREAWVHENIRIYRKIKQAGVKLLKDSAARSEFMNELFKIRKIKIVDDTGNIDFSQDENSDLTGINENNF